MTKTVFITGASAGAGKAMAYRFAKEGFNLYLVARRSEKLEAIKLDIEDKHGVGVKFYAADLSKADELNAVGVDALKHGIDVMINNAGLGDWNFVWDVDPAKFRAMIDLNAIALATLSTQFVKERKETDACLINVTSLAGYFLFPGSVPYSATKFFATAFTEGLYRDLQAARSPMRVKVMTPGPIDTEFTAISLKDSKLQGLDASKVRFHTPDQIADFTYQLFKSDKPVGIVDLESMEFVLRDTIHAASTL
ncbi:MAG: SDR family NAD(P)-dependent oxidoreductase [Pseudomonadales bacterium]